MIKFRCSVCSKAIGVDEKYAGRLIKCPSCQNATRVPQPVDGEDVPVAQAVPAVPTQQAFEATVAHVPKTGNPSCPSCQSELFNPSDNMCGICGHLLEQAPLVSAAPISPRPVANSPVAQIPPAGTPVGAIPTATAAPEYGLPVNPAVASPYAKPMKGQAGGYDPLMDYDSSRGSTKKSSQPSTGKSVGATFGAIAIGMFLALIWGVIASFTGAFGQVFAWAIGAIVGLVAGLIARNPSIPFCLTTAGAALLCMLFGRLVSAWVIMMAVSTMSTFNDYLMLDTGVTMGVMEDMSSKGEFEGEEKVMADMRVEAFFESKDLYDIPEYEGIDYETVVDVDKKVRDVINEMSKEEKMAVLDRVRKDHPGWMEESWHFEAILDSMVVAGEIEDEDLLAHANAKLAYIDGESGGDYYQDTTPRQMDEREEKLRELVIDKFKAMTPEQREEAIRNARLNHPSWSPVEHEYLAMLDAMVASDDIPRKLKKRSQSVIKLNLKMEFDDVWEEQLDEDYEKEEQEDLELRALVNAELLKLSQEEIDKLVESTKERYPDWTPSSGDAALEMLSDGLDETIASFESDGTFWSSLKTRFKTLDFVWLALGMISAFAIAFTLGQAGKKSGT